MVLKLGHFVKCIRNSWKVVKCGAGQGWRRSVGQIVLEMKQYYIESRTGIPHIQLKKGGRLTRFVTSCVGTAC
jgi:hypothetical protein